MVSIFVMAYQSNDTSENAGKPGDNALWSVIRALKCYGYQLAGVEVAVLPSGVTIPLQRQKKAVKQAENSILVVFGSDTLRAIKQWFPHSEMVVLPHQFTFMNEPGRIMCEIIPKVEAIFNKPEEIFGFNLKTKTIGDE